MFLIIYHNNSNAGDIKSNHLKLFRYDQKIVKFWVCLLTMQLIVMITFQCKFEMTIIIWTMGPFLRWKITIGNKKISCE